MYREDSCNSIIEVEFYTGKVCSLHRYMYLTTCLLYVQFFKINFKWQFVCKFDTMTYPFFIVFVYLYAYAFAYILTSHGNIRIQYIPRIMHTVFALLCFVVVIHWLIFPYPSGLLHWHCGNLTIAPVPAKQPWWIWINASCEFIMNDCITTRNQQQTVCIFLGIYCTLCLYTLFLRLKCTVLSLFQRRNFDTFY